MDENREIDGHELRYRFGTEKSIDRSYIDIYLSEHGCSVLEMMVALAIKCEEEIMYDPSEGDRTSSWFWEMLTSLNLVNYTNDNWNYASEKEIIQRLNIFLDRKYLPDGRGGLFTVRSPKEDMKNVEIWFQMCWYISDISN
jgi:hypothetical protein